MRRFTKEIILVGILLLFLLPVSECQDEDDVKEAPVVKIDDGQSRGKKLSQDIVLSVRSWLPGKVKEQLEEAKRDNVTVQVTLAVNVAAELGRTKELEMLLDYSGLPSDELRTPPPNGRTPLMSAASENRVRATELLLRRRPPPDVNATEDYGRTAMHLAALAGHREAVELLVRRGANVNSLEPRYGNSPLHYAAVLGLEGAVRAILKAPALEIDAQDSRGLTALFLATWNGHLKAVEIMVRTGGANIGVPCHGMLNWTALHWAASIGRTDMVRFFVEEGGMNPGVTTPNGETPLFMAAMYNRLETLEYLISTNVNFDKRGIFRISPMMWSAHNGHVEVVKRLLELDVDLNARIDLTELTPLMWSSSEGHLQIVNLLLSKKGTIVDLRDKRRRSALHYASAWGGLEVTRALVLEGKADPEARDESGRTPLHHAAMEGRMETARWTVEEAKADAAAEDGDGWRPADAAAPRAEAEEGIEVMEFLIEREGGRGGRGKRNSRLLFQASLGGHLPAVDYILGKGEADPTEKVGTLPQEGAWSTPLHAAATRGHLDVLERLMEAAEGGGGNVLEGTVDSEGRTVLETAEEEGQKNVAEFFKDMN